MLLLIFPLPIVQVFRGAYDKRWKSELRRTAIIEAVTTRQIFEIIHDYAIVLKRTEKQKNAITNLEVDSQEPFR